MKAFILSKHISQFLRGVNSSQIIYISRFATYVVDITITWMKRMENYPSQFPADVADGTESRYAERIIMPNFFDMRRNSYVMKD